jgi:hypothetical protein
VQATSALHLTNSSSPSSQSFRVLMQIKWGSNAASGQTAEANAAGGQNSRTRIVRPRHHRRWDRVLVAFTHRSKRPSAWYKSMMARAMSCACSSSITFNVATNRPSVPFGSSEVSAAISSANAGRSSARHVLGTEGDRNGASIAKFRTRRKSHICETPRYRAILSDIRFIDAQRPDSLAGAAGFEPLHLGLRLAQDSQPGREDSAQVTHGDVVVVPRPVQHAGRPR